jgi:hypothetical protein
VAGRLKTGETLTIGIVLARRLSCTGESSPVHAGTAAEGRLHPDAESCCIRMQ